MWLHDKQIGVGFLIHHGDHTHGPYLNDGKGNAIPQGWYTLKCTDHRDITWPGPDSGLF